MIRLSKLADYGMMLMGQIAAHQDRCLSALELADRVGDTNLLYMVHHQLALLAQQAGRIDQARGHFQKAFTVIDSIAERAGSAREAFLSKPPVEAVFRDAAKL